MATDIRVHESVLALLRMLLRTPASGCRMFVSGVETLESSYAPMFLGHFQLTALASKATDFTKYLSGSSANIIVDSRYQMYKPTECMHYALVIPQYQLLADDGFEVASDDPHPGKLSLYPVTVGDPMLFWRCSKGKELERSAQMQVMQIEQAYHAVLPGGYFAAVLPKKWIGDKMDFMRWFANNVGSVAKIKLPPNTVTSTAGDSLGEWYLYIWTKPCDPDGTEKQKKKLKSLRHTELRWPTFIQPMRNLDEGGDTERLSKLFRHHDWYRHHLRHWLDIVKEGRDEEYRNTYTSPVELASPERTRIYQPGPSCGLTWHTVATVNDMMQDPMAVQIKPGRRVKLTAFNRRAYAALMDITERLGYTIDTKTSVSYGKFETLLKSSLTQVKEELVRLLLEFGLQPYILERDIAKIKKQERWLNRQLAPIERWVKIKTDAEDGNANSWELMYEDVGLRATHPEVLEQWRQRMVKSGIYVNEDNHFAFTYQADNILAGACKDGMVNADVPGLGKTIQTLLEFLLRTKKRILLVMPSKLIQEWKNDIERLLTIFVRRNRWNWRREVHDISFQVIRYASHLENLKAINIISYEKLWSVPKDATFHVCPECSYVTCSPAMHEHQYCTSRVEKNGVVVREGCTDKKLRAWKELCKKEKLRKYVATVNSNGETIKVHARMWYPGTNRVDEVKLEKFLAKRPEIVGACMTTDWQVVDDRPPRPKPVACKMVNKRYKKMAMKKVKVGNDIVEKLMPRTPHLKWTFAELVRWRFSMAAADEILYIKNEETNRGEALWKVTSCIRRGLGGTPMRGKPKNVVNIFNWVTKKPVYPDYRRDDPLGNIKFMRKFATYVDMEYDNGDKKRQLLPKIGNPELFQTEIAAAMCRHTRIEPIVLKDIPLKPKQRIVLPLKMDDQHYEYYKKWLDKFSEWWAKKREKVHGEKAGATARESLIVKMTYLINASSIPHFIHDNIILQLKDKARKRGEKRKAEGRVATVNDFAQDADDNEFMEWAKSIGPYKGPLTTKQKKVLELVAEAATLGDKIMIGSWRRKNLEIGKSWCDANKINSLLCDGTVSTAVRGDGSSMRGDMIADFRNLEYTAMWCGLTALSEGVNVPECNRSAVIDYSWEPSEVEQFVARKDRPQQTKMQYNFYLRHEGTIDDYLYLTNILKANSAGEGIDFMEFDLKAEMIPDVRQYADAIVDGTETKQRAKMQLAVDKLQKRKEEEEGE